MNYDRHIDIIMPSQHQLRAELETMVLDDLLGPLGGMRSCSRGSRPSIPRPSPGCASKVIMPAHRKSVAGLMDTYLAAIADGPHTPVVRPKAIGSLNWRRLPASRLMMGLHNFIESARELRRAKYGKCERCDETKPPEWMHDDKTCQLCAEWPLGLVY